MNSFSRMFGVIALGGLCATSAFAQSAEELAKQLSNPINFLVGKVLTIGSQPVQITGGIRYWAESPENGPDDFGARLVVTYLFPK